MTKIEFPFAACTNVQTKKDLEALAETRLGDARHLFQATRHSAAYYLGGYAVELGIKACIAGLFQANVIPERPRNFTDSVKRGELLWKRT